MIRLDWSQQEERPLPALSEKNHNSKPRHLTPPWAFAHLCHRQPPCPYSPFNNCMNPSGTLSEQNSHNVREIWYIKCHVNFNTELSAVKLIELFETCWCLTAVIPGDSDSNRFWVEELVMRGFFLLQAYGNFSICYKTFWVPYLYCISKAMTYHTDQCWAIIENISVFSRPCCQVSGWFNWCQAVGKNDYYQLWWPRELNKYLIHKYN